MTDVIPESLVWWITAVDIPLITSFVITLTKFKNDIERDVNAINERLNRFKLHVAQNYASINHVKDLEARLIAHLLRIETKLDNTALKAHAVYVSPTQKEV